MTQIQATISTPIVENTTDQSEITSRSGRKIKPKRYVNNFEIAETSITIVIILLSRYLHEEIEETVVTPKRKAPTDSSIHNSKPSKVVKVCLYINTKL